MIERLMAPGTFHQAPYCHAARAGNFLFVTGQVAADPATGEYVLGDIETETRRVHGQPRDRPRDAPASPSRDVVSARAFLTRSGEYDAFNRIYTEYLGEFLPTRTTIGVVALAAGARVEVDLVAYRD